MPKRIYVAGPYTNPDPVDNTRRAIRAGHFLLLQGFTPFVPHLSLFWHFQYPLPIEKWYAYDLEWLAVCDGLVRLPGESEGATQEVFRAEDLDLPIFYGDTDDDAIKSCVNYAHKEGWIGNEAS